MDVLTVPPPTPIPTDDIQLVVSLQIQARPADFDRLLDHFRRAMLPILRRQSGHHLSTVLTNEACGTMILLTQWDSPRHRQAFVASPDYGAYTAAAEAAWHLLTGPPLVASYQVRLQG